MILLLAVCITLLFAGTAQAQPHSDEQGHVYIGPVQERAHGPGIHRDAPGRAFPWQPDQGMQRGPTPTLQEEPTSYGLDVRTDQPGRMATPQPMPPYIQQVNPPIGLQNQRGTR